MQMLDMVSSIVAGIGACIAVPSGLALLAGGHSCEWSLRALIGWLVVVACGWCATEAIYGTVNGPEALLMVILSIQSWLAMRTRRQMRRASDLSPFAGTEVHHARVRLADPVGEGILRDR